MLSKVDNLVFMDLFFVHGALIFSMLHIIFLKAAFSGLVTDGAVNRVVDEMKFKT